MELLEVLAFIHPISPKAGSSIAGFYVQFQIFFKKITLKNITMPEKMDRLPRKTLHSVKACNYAVLSEGYYL